jgi:hypothetical protein
MEFRATEAIGYNMLKGRNIHEYPGCHWTTKPKGKRYMDRPKARRIDQQHLHSWVFRGQDADVLHRFAYVTTMTMIISSKAIIKLLISFSSQTQISLILLLSLMYGYYMFRPTSGHRQVHSTKIKRRCKGWGLPFFLHENKCWQNFLKNAEGAVSVTPYMGIILRIVCWL